LSSRSFNLSFRLTVGVPLLAVAAGAWYLSAYLYQATPSMAMGPSIGALPIATMMGVFGSPNVGQLSTFLVVWLVGMIAMMFPAMIPVTSFYSGTLKNEGASNSPSVLGLSSLFLSGYLLLYLLLGCAMFGAVYLAFQLGSIVPSLAGFSAAGLTAVLFFTGLWQLTPLKEKSLAKCVSPMGFFASHFRRGPTGAFRMGAEHGFYCVGCCWLYMLVMLAVAAMSLPSMVLLSGLIIVEKAFVGRARWFRWVSAGIFFSLAAAVAVFPAYLGLL